MPTHAYRHHKYTCNSNNDNRADLYVDNLLPNEEWTVKYQEVDAYRELEKAPKDRPEGNDI